MDLGRRNSGIGRTVQGHLREWASPKATRERRILSIWDCLQWFCPKIGDWPGEFCTEEATISIWQWRTRVLGGRDACGPLLSSFPSPRLKAYISSQLRVEDCLGREFIWSFTGRGSFILARFKCLRPGSQPRDLPCCFFTATSLPPLP